MTVDVEDYFQVQAFATTIDRARWDSFPARVEANTQRILDQFAERRAQSVLPDPFVIDAGTLQR